MAENRQLDAVDRYLGCVGAEASAIQADGGAFRPRQNSIDGGKIVIQDRQFVLCREYLGGYQERCQEQT
jgi:hypothetical protein